MQCHDGIVIMVPCESCLASEHTIACDFELCSARASRRFGQRPCAGCAVMVDGTELRPPCAQLQAR